MPRLDQTERRLILEEFSESFKREKPAHDPAFIARYVGAVGHEDRAPDEQSKLSWIGLKIPQIERVYKAGWSFSSLPDADQVDVWDAIYFGSKTFEARAACLMWWDDKRRAALSVKESKRLLSWVSGIDNWAHSDSLSCVLARVLEAKPSAILPTLKKWNRSKNPWERRQSVVSLLYFASLRKKTPDRATVFALVERLLEDPHFYVQKGVGWTLREAYNVWPKAQVAFVKKNLAKISGTAWFAASEKYPPALKKEFVAKRKLLRKNK